MQRRHVLFTLLATAVLTIPAAQAWSSRGGVEPDTRYDLDRHLMFLLPDWNASGLKVYFNAFPYMSSSGVNLNSGALATQVAPFGEYEWGAFLGVWKDCNRDGYVGMADTAVLEYRAELLRDASVCPRQNNNDRYGHVFNDGQWIYEFFWIGPHSTAGRDSLSQPLVNPRSIHDAGAAIWGDIGAPGEAIAGVCSTGIPYGFTSSTGVMVKWGDCLLRGQVTGAVNTVDDEGLLGLRFDDPSSPERSGSRLNQDSPLNLWENPYGGPGNDRRDEGALDRNTTHPAFTFWDCDEETRVKVDDPTDGALNDLSVTDPTGQVPVGIADEDGTIGLTGNVSDPETGNLFESPVPGPAVGDPGNSFQEGMNDVWRGCDPDGTICPVCNPDYFRDLDTRPESEVEGQSLASGKHKNDVVFDYSHGGTYPPPAIQGRFGRSTPQYFGLHALEWGVLRGPAWRSVGGWIDAPQSIDALGGGAPQGAQYATFYADVNPNAIAGLELPGAGGTYGSDWCLGDVNGVTATGWDCNPDRWYERPYTIEAMPTREDGSELGRRTGASYDLIDVDCFDGMIGAAGARASLAESSDAGVCR